MARSARFSSLGFVLASQLILRSIARRKRFLFSGSKSMSRLLARPQLTALEDRTLLSTSIFGTVFNDLSHSGIFQAADPGLAGKTVFLDLNNDGQFDSTTTTFGNSAPSVDTNNPFGAPGSTIQVQNIAPTIENVTVSLNLHE